MHRTRHQNLVDIQRQKAIDLNRRAKTFHLIWVTLSWIGSSHVIAVVK